MLRKMFVIVTVIGLLGIIGIMTIPAADAETITDSDGHQIAANAYWGKSFEGNEGDTIYVAVYTDVPVDILLMDFNDFGEYKAVVQGERDTFTYYNAGSKMSVTQFEYSFVLPDDTTYYILIDNTQVPDGGAYCEDGVIVGLGVTIDRYEIEPDQESSDTSDDTPFLGIGSVIVTILFSITLIRKRKLI